MVGGEGALTMCLISTLGRLSRESRPAPRNIGHRRAPHDSDGALRRGDTWRPSGHAAHWQSQDQGAVGAPTPPPPSEHYRGGVGRGVAVVEEGHPQISGTFHASMARPMPPGDFSTVVAFCDG